jgi:hypothetical protein
MWGYIQLMETFKTVLDEFIEKEESWWKVQQIKFVLFDQGRVTWEQEAGQYRPER